MLLSTPSKVFCRIILKRLKNALDRKLRCEQAGFKKRQILHRSYCIPEDNNRTIYKMADPVIHELYRLRQSFQQR